MELNNIPLGQALTDDIMFQAIFIQHLKKSKSSHHLQVSRKSSKGKKNKVWAP